MAKLIDSCEKYFDSRDFYEVLKIEKTASEKEVKKAYHKLSLLVHPDRVDEKTKEEATEKFKVLGFIHSVLSDKDKRKIYDETGQYDEEGDEETMKNWADYWRALFKPITVQDITNYEKNYKGSAVEIKDLKRAYMDSNGDMDYILEAVPFTNCEEEDRLREIISKLVEAGEVPEYKSFINEPKKKRERRKRKWAKEAAEAAKPDDENESCDDLVLAIQNRNKARTNQADNFFNSLIEKYANEAEKGTTSKKGKPARKKRKS